MNPWTRASAGRPTGVVGVLDPAPSGLTVVRARCGPDLKGLLGLAAGLPLPKHPASAFLAPAYRRLTRDELPFHGPSEVPDVPEGTVLVLEELERADEPTLLVLNRWVSSRRDLPLLLCAKSSHASINRLAEVHGAGAVHTGTAAATGLSTLPEDFIALVLHVTEHGPITLEQLAQALGKTPLRVRAALLQAGLRGAEVQRDEHGRLSVSASLQAAFSAEERTSPPMPPLQRARLATAIGAWDAAARLYRTVRDGAIEGAAIAWAKGDPATALQQLEAAPESAEKTAGSVSLLWDTLAPLETLLQASNDLPQSEALLTRAAAVARAGEVQRAGDLISEGIQDLDPEHKTDALHLMAKLPLLGPGSLVVGRRAASEAYQALEEGDPQRALLIETTARLSLRARNVREAAKQFQKALHQLSPDSQSVPFARAVAGLATSADLVGRKEDLLTWLQRAIEANRHQPHGLSWCNAALDILMERIEIDDGHTLSALQRQAMQLASLRAERPDPQPLEAL